MGVAEAALPPTGRLKDGVSGSSEFSKSVLPNPPATVGAKTTVRVDESPADITAPDIVSLVIENGVANPEAGVIVRAVAPILVTVMIPLED